MMRVDVVDVHGDVLGRGAGALRAERAMGALGAEPDHAVAELDHRVVDRAVRALAPRGRDLAEPERALQERERGTDVLDTEAAERSLVVAWAGPPAGSRP